jgi:hypothetical protein
MNQRFPFTEVFRVDPASVGQEKRHSVVLRVLQEVSCLRRA